jgi:fructose-1,6-bisphosphatase
MAYYPSSRLDLQEDLDADLWVSLFRDVDDNALLLALAEYVRSGSTFSPSAGDIAARCVSSARLPGKSAMNSKQTQSSRCWESALRHYVDSEMASDETNMAGYRLTYERLMREG